jgi:hypothetical protein
VTNSEIIKAQMTKSFGLFFFIPKKIVFCLFHMYNVCIRPSFKWATMNQQSTDRVWYTAKLLPAAASVFTEGFYPEKKRTGAQYVYFTQIDASPTNSKILMASRLAENSFRMITADFAKHCLEPKGKATKDDANQLNILSAHLERNL